VFNHPKIFRKKTSYWWEEDTHTIDHNPLFI
jgi:hypothetical protein